MQTRTFDNDFSNEIISRISRSYLFQLTNVIWSDAPRAHDLDLPAISHVTPSRIQRAFCDKVVYFSRRCTPPTLLLRPLNRQLICVATLNTHSAVHKTFHKQAHRYKVPTNLPRWLGGGNKLFGCGPLPLVSVFHDSVEPAKMFSSQYQAQVVAGRLCKDTSWLNVSPLLYIVMLLI